MERNFSAAERVARLITQQAVARGSSSPDGRKKPVRQSPRLSSKSDRSTGSDMRSGSPPKRKLKSLSFAEALMGPTPEEKKARGRVEARKRRRKKEPEEGKDGKKKEAFIICQSFDNIGRELISLVATSLQPSERLVSRMWRPRPRLTKPCSCPWLRRWAKCSLAVKIKQYELNPLRDWVTPMALTLARKESLE